MASAQVLPTSRKQEHLEAGKRRLEEFRKKKASERAKKAAFTSQPHASDGTTEHVRVIESDGVGTSGGPVGVVISDNKANDFAQKSREGSSDGSHSKPPSANYYNISSADLVQTHTNNQETKKNDASGSAGPTNVYNSVETKDSNNDFRIHTKPQGVLSYESASDQLIGIHRQSSQDYDRSSTKSSFHGIEESHSKESESSVNISPFLNPGFSHDFVAKLSSQSSASTLPQSKSSDASMGNDHRLTSFYEDFVRPTTRMTGSVLEAGQNQLGSLEFREPIISDLEERKSSISASALPSLQSEPVQTSDSSGFSFDVTSSSSSPLYSARTETNANRSRPSFLDSLNVPRASMGTHFQHTEPEKGSIMSSRSQYNGVDVLGASIFQKPSAESNSMGSFSKLGSPNPPSAFEHSGNSLVSASNGTELGVNENSFERKHEFYSRKQNEDFAALEQHIEDLTQEKFSLQRALEASRALAESLAAENSSLTDSYNQQRSVVNQLKSDMEKLQEEIKAQLVELESLRNESATARLECHAADERANILASEVIGLEDKALRLRSNELKLERQLENSQAEISSYKKKVSSVEKDRQDLHSTINALQEEKKVLQSMLRNASASGKSIDANKSPTSRKDMSTSTEDLANAETVSDSSKQETHSTASLLQSDMTNLSFLLENGQSTLEESSVNIPPDQMRMIQNINGLISELAVEKEELMQALSSESSQSTKLKELNKELSRKLETQTQRLELLTAQTMANDNISARQPDSGTTHDNTTYADEGDEVVERVLGWIMKLFPGGPSRRRTSKLL